MLFRSIIVLLLVNLIALSVDLTVIVPEEIDAPIKPVPPGINVVPVIIFNNIFYINYYNFKKENLPVINEYIKKWENHYKRKMPEEINFYSLRERLENLLKNQKKYNILFLPEKNSYESQIKNEELSKLLNKSRMAVACSTLADICMHKYMEILASHCMILGNIPTDYQSMMKDKICEVTLNMTDNQILAKIDSYLNDADKLEKLTDELYNDVHNNHNYDEAIKDFNVLFENIIKNIKI